jgi:hypothetical protein
MRELQICHRLQIPTIAIRSAFGFQLPDRIASVFGLGSDATRQEHPRWFAEEQIPYQPCPSSVVLADGRHVQGKLRQHCSKNWRREDNSNPMWAFGYSSVDSDDVVLTMSDSAFHGTPH